MDSILIPAPILATTKRNTFVTCKYCCSLLYIYSFYNTKINTVPWISGQRNRTKSGYCVYGYMTVPWNSFESVDRKSMRRLGMIRKTHSISVGNIHCHCASGPYADWLVSHLAWCIIFVALWNKQHHDLYCYSWKGLQVASNSASTKSRNAASL